MEFGFYDLLKLLGSLALFIYGMKIMSEGIQSVAGSKMKQILGAMTSNRFLGVLTGLLITTIVQSSSATTVMVVSFVNAGLLTLGQSIGVIMGANIGTTVTAWIISILGFKVKMSQLALPIIAFGLPMMFTSRKKTQEWGHVLIGFALLFIGLDALQSSMPKLDASQMSFLSQFTDKGVLTTLLFVGVGTLITIIVQSSSASMALTLVLTNQGVIPFEVAAAMVLGENIGTTITANLAALVGNTAAKRAARSHLIFNLFGVFWMLLVFTPFLHLISTYMQQEMGMADPSLPGNAHTVPIALSIFHTVFNITNTLLLLGLIRYIQRFVEWAVPEKEGEDDTIKLSFINANTGELMAAEAQLTLAEKEVLRFAESLQVLPDWTQEVVGLGSEHRKERKKQITKIRKMEESADAVEEQLVQYLVDLNGKGVLSENAMAQVRSYLRITHDLERISDVYTNMTFVLEKRYEEKIWLLEGQRDEILDFLKLTKEAYAIMLGNLNVYLLGKGKIDYEAAERKEKELNKMRSQLRKTNLVRSVEMVTDTRHALAYNDLISSVEKVGDHIFNISEALKEIRA